VRADAADRIGAAPSPESLEPRVSIPRIFAVGLVLPFAHLHRVILAGLIPAILVVGFFMTPVGAAALDFGRFVSELYASGVAASPAAGPPPSVAAAGWALLVIFIATALWLCGWQRAAARDFAEPIGRWLLQSVIRLPGYTVALIVWTIMPFIATLPGTTLIGWALQRSVEKAEVGMPNGLGVSPHMLTPVQWWVAGIGALTFALLGLWVSARLSSLPALVASQGWRRSSGRAWRFSGGHGLRAFGFPARLFAYRLSAHRGRFDNRPLRCDKARQHDRLRRPRIDQCADHHDRHAGGWCCRYVLAYVDCRVAGARECRPRRPARSYDLRLSLRMILESALLDVKPGQETAFEAAMKEARPLIAATPGFRSIAVRRCLETPNRYLLLVEWEKLEDHTVGFRQSPRYQEWRALLHHFYDPFPTVEHFGANVLGGD